MCKKCQPSNNKCFDVIMLELGFSEENIELFKHFFIHIIMKVLTFIVARRWGECNLEHPTNKSKYKVNQYNHTQAATRSELKTTERRDRRTEIIWRNKGFVELEERTRLNQMNHLREIELRRDQLIGERVEQELRHAELQREHEQLVQERDRLTQRLEELQIENRRLRRTLSRHHRYEMQLWQWIFRISGIQIPQFLPLLRRKGLLVPGEESSEQFQDVSEESEISDSDSDSDYDYEEISDSDSDDDYDDMSSEFEYLVTDDDEIDDSES